MIRAMALSPDDRAAIAEPISLHGHASVGYDVSELGGGALRGEAGRRIDHRRVVPRRVPLNGRRG
jgi:hypothetical protein